MSQNNASASESAYAAFVAGRAKPMGGLTLDLLHGAVGIAGEAGELLDCVKKSWVYNKPLNRENLLEECGDVLFYLQHVINEAGWTMGDLRASNVAKLSRRYPDGYSDAAAQARADKTAGGQA